MDLLHDTHTHPDEFESTLSSVPAASFTATPDVGTLPLAVAFQSTTVDSDGDFVRFAWDFGDGTGGEGATTSHVYDAPGD